jgi:Zn finger protein HypA/HybF involved in hydrogenase expression
MQEKPYYCPNCRSNRVKFSIVSSTSQRFLKDAVTGSIIEQFEVNSVEQSEPSIQCMVCNFTGNEMRFIKQAEREPRVMTDTNPTYQ